MERLVTLMCCVGSTNLLYAGPGEYLDELLSVCR